MNSRNLIDNLNKLREVVPSEEWKGANRAVLMQQISATQSASSKKNFGFFYNTPLLYVRLMPQSVLIAVFALVFASSGAYFSLQAAENSVPGDSLYVAKIAAEKTQLAFTFDEKDKARLGLEFAANRAKEIDLVLSAPEQAPDQGQKVEKLVVDFKKEIGDAKARLEKISSAGAEPIAKTSPADPAKQPESDVQKPAAAQPQLAKGEPEASKPEEKHVFGANLGKDNSGVDLYEPGTETKGAPAAKAPETASSTETTAADTQILLDQAKDSLQNDDIGATLDLIAEAGQVIEQVGGSVEGVSEVGGAVTDKATTTDE